MGRPVARGGLLGNVPGHHQRFVPHHQTLGPISINCIIDPITNSYS